LPIEKRNRLAVRFKSRDIVEANRPTSAQLHGSQEREGSRTHKLVSPEINHGIAPRSSRPRS
jgi:hypothetical protein